MKPSPDAIELAKHLMHAFETAPKFGDKIIALRVGGNIYRMAETILREAQRAESKTTCA